MSELEMMISNATDREIQHDLGSFQEQLYNLDRKRSELIKKIAVLKSELRNRRGETQALPEQPTMPFYDENAGNRHWDNF